jgi:hypothetical protein
MTDDLLISRIKKAVNESLELNIVRAVKLTAGTTNIVYKITPEHSAELVIKIFTKAHWTECGKLDLVNQLLSERGIVASEIEYFTRDNKHFKYGLVNDNYTFPLTTITLPCLGWS